MTRFWTHLFAYDLPEAPGVRKLLAMKPVKFCIYKYTIDDGYQGPDFHEESFDVVLGGGQVR